MSGWSAVVFPQFLHKRKGFFINDGRMCVFEYLPFFLWLFHTFLVFKRFCRNGFEIQNHAAIHQPKRAAYFRQRSALSVG